MGDKLKIATYFSTLIKYAKAEAAARASGDPERIMKATEEHEQYRQMCLSADQMVIPITRGDICRR